MKILTLLICAVGLCLTLFASAAFSQTTPDTSAERELGEKLFKERRYSEAEGALKKAVKNNKSDSEAWYYLGLTYLRQQDFKNATKAFETLLQLQPTSAIARTALARSLLHRNKFSEALKESEKAVAADSKSAEAHFILGASYLRLGARDKALAEAERAIEIDKEFADAYLLKSQALVRFSGDVMVRQIQPVQMPSNRYEEAAASLETYLKLTPDSDEQPLWKDQLSSLKFYMAMRSTQEREQNNVYSQKDVTTKVRLIYKPEPKYTEAAKQNQTRGTIVLRALFASDATVKHIVVLYGLPDGLTWEAVRSAKQIRFAPATLNGKPVSTFINLEYNFNIF